MSAGISDLLNRIKLLEKQIKTANPKQRGMVLIANAETNASYEVDKSDQFRWSVAYYDELQKLIN